jgi:catechol 2,3-dioxygenase-like lactoylglutathione lyase family enzyme
MGFIPTRDFSRARAFYVGLLDLTLVNEDNFALEVASGSTHIRITRVEAFTPFPFTLLGWRVEEIVSTVRDLTAKGIHFERYSFLQQDEDAIWAAPGGTKVAWFRDPEGNILSLSQHTD